MKYWINKDSEQLRTVSSQQQFFGVEVAFPVNVAEAMIKFEEQWREYQEYLRKVEGQLATRDPNINIMKAVEVPAWLGVPEEAPKEEPRSEPDIDPLSSKKSREPLKRRDIDLNTNRKKVE